MRPESDFVYHFRRIVTDDEFCAWLAAIAGAVALTLATVLMGVRP
jgi:hypothetical protein